MAQNRREKLIARLDVVTVNLLVDSISNLMSKHNEPYRTLAECIMLAVNETHYPACFRDGNDDVNTEICKQIDLAVKQDCPAGSKPKRMKQAVMRTGKNEGNFWDAVAKLEKKQARKQNQK